MKADWHITSTFLLLTVSLTACNRDAANRDTATAAVNAEPRRVEPALVLPADTPLLVTLQQPLSTKDNTSGETFRTTLVTPVSVQGKNVLPKGATLMGRITTLQQAGDGKPTTLRLVLAEVVLPSGARKSIRTHPLTLTAQPSTEKDIEKVAAGGVAGGVVGGIVGGKKGAAIGAAIGAGAGTAVALATRDNTIRLDEGQQLEFRLEESLSVPAASA